MTLILDQIPLDLGDIGVGRSTPAMDSQTYIRPFLKWAGGKYLLLGRIFDALPKGSRLIEPFTGSAVVAINSGFESTIATDSNADLINLYKAIQYDTSRFIDEAVRLFTPAGNTREAFDLNRAEFNQCADRFRRSVLFVYLNRHCFNGLCRYNSKGKFNVPFGRYTSPTFPHEAIARFARAAGNIEFHVADYLSAMDAARPGDVIYCDPPYVPLSATANFASYATEGFGFEDQKRLAQKAIELKNRGVPVVVSNHDTSVTRELYDQHAKITSFEVQRRISRDASTRGAAAELLAVFA